MRSLLRAAVAAFALMLAAACGGAGSTSSSAGSPASGGSTAAPSAAASGSLITIKDFAFTGALTVRPGATVTVRNDDTVPHNLTAQDGSFKTATINGNGGTGTFTAPAKPGSYLICCTFHPNMHGTLVVATSTGSSGTGSSGGGAGGY